MAQAPETERAPDGDRQQSLQSLERGMAVIQVFSRERPALTLSEVANLTGITRATARRILLTLEKLGHVRSDGRLFSPTPRLLTLGWAYLSSLNLSELALPLMETLVEETHESCSAATLDLPDVVYVARVPTRRIMSITLSVGTRLPAHCTSMGRVLLAALAPDELDRYLAGPPLEAWTERTTTDPERLRAALDETRQRGWALVDQELEIGLRSVAAPIRRADPAGACLPPHRQLSAVGTPSERPGVDPVVFREALASVAAPVAVVTSFDGERPHGTTVSAFCSLSLEPPLVLVSLDRDSELLRMIRASRRYGINVLSHDQEELATRFARKGTDKFAAVRWSLDTDLPRLDGTSSWIACRLHDLMDGGDHMIAVGFVEHAQASPSHPLLYRQRQFGTLNHRPPAQSG